MKIILLLLLSIGLLLLCSCTFFDAKKSAPTSVVQQPRPLVLPVGKNWKVIEEAPKLSDERGQLPFQAEQSIKPEGAPLSPDGERKIEISR